MGYRATAVAAVLRVDQRATRRARRQQVRMPHQNKDAVVPSKLQCSLWGRWLSNIALQQARSHRICRRDERREDHERRDATVAVLRHCRGCGRWPLGPNREWLLMTERLNSLDGWMDGWRGTAVRWLRFPGGCRLVAGRDWHLLVALPLHPTTGSPCRPKPCPPD